jgi:hypothetical protein
MKVIDANYSVKMGYWALRNNMQEYKVYATMIQIFNLDFLNNLRQVLGDNLWPIELTNNNYRIQLLCQVKYLLGTNKAEEYSLVEASRKECLENENDLDDDKYELPISKYDANQDAIVE